MQTSKITDIQKQKKHTHLYSIFVDDVFYCSLSDLQLSLLGLSIGKQLSRNDLEQIKSDSEIDKTYNRALFYLQYGPRTEYQMSSYLTQKGYDEQYISIIIQKLKDSNLINDYNYTQSFVTDKRTIGLKSDTYIRNQLIKKGVDKSIIESVLSKVDADNQLDVLKELMVKRYKQSEKYRDKQKMTQYLLRQGFRYFDISNAFDELDLVFGSDKKMYNNPY